MRLVSYAGWNTAGNTMGTAIPAANVYLLAKRSPHIDQLKSEVAQHEFLLHRYVNDFAYHRVTRAEAYQQIAADGFGSPDEIYGAEYDKINDFVQQDLGRWLETYFQEQFLGRHFLAGQREFEFSGIDDVRIWLPWPRAYEVRLQFKLEARPVEAAEVGKSASR